MLLCDQWGPNFPRRLEALQALCEHPVDTCFRGGKQQQQVHLSSEHGLQQALEELESTKAEFVTLPAGAIDVGRYTAAKGLPARHKCLAALKGLAGSM